MDGRKLNVQFPHGKGPSGQSMGRPPPPRPGLYGVRVCVRSSMISPHLRPNTEPWACARAPDLCSPSLSLGRSAAGRTLARPAPAPPPYRGRRLSGLTHASPQRLPCRGRRLNLPPSVSWQDLKDFGKQVRGVAAWAASALPSPPGPEAAGALPRLPAARTRAPVPGAPPQRARRPTRAHVHPPVAPDPAPAALPAGGAGDAGERLRRRPRARRGAAGVLGRVGRGAGRAAPRRGGTQGEALLAPGRRLKAVPHTSPAHGTQGGGAALLGAQRGSGSGPLLRGALGKAARARLLAGISGRGTLALWAPLSLLSTWRHSHGTDGLASLEGLVSAPRIWRRVPFWSGQWWLSTLLALGRLARGRRGTGSARIACYVGLGSGLWALSLGLRRCRSHPRRL